jgi:hypothetical protein
VQGGAKRVWENQTNECGKSKPIVNAKMLATQLLAINADVKAVCEGLTGHELTSRPDPAMWSIAEILAHLCATTEAFLPAVDHAVTEIRRRGFVGSGPYHLGWYGSLLVWFVEPPPVIRLPTPKALLPRLSASPEQILGKFLVLQGAMFRRMEDASDLSLTKRRFSLPLARFIRMNLLEFFSVFNAHSRRHLWQAANVRRMVLINESRISGSIA